MTYSINRFSTTKLVDVEDGRINDEYTHIKFVGRNYAGYGEVQNENFLWLLENFASSSEPAKKISGMIWYDSGNKKLKFYDGSKFRTTGGAEIGTTKPSGMTQGDLWYNTSTRQMFTYDPSYTLNNGFVLIGPQGVEGKQQTSFESVKVRGTDENDYAIVEAIVDGVVEFIVSSSSFTLKSSVNTIPGFTYIREGITLVNAAPDTDAKPGTTLTGYDTRFWGTASDSDRLGGELASAYLLKASPTFENQANFPNSGIQIGAVHDIKIFVDTANSNQGTMINQVSDSLYFKTTASGNQVRSPLILKNLDVTPGVNLTYNLGTQSLKWATVWCGELHATTIYADIQGSLTGNSASSDRLKVDDGATDPLWSVSHYRTAKTTATAYTIAARDSNGDLTANVFHGVATQARYADLAERYEADGYYEPGTVVVFGGEKEITVTDNVSDIRVAGVVSTDPAYLMNAEAGDNMTHPAIALKGKIPCKVVGSVRKGDVLVTSYLSGHAEVASNPMSVPAAAIVGKSLENKVDSGSGIIMIVV